MDIDSALRFLSDNTDGAEIYFMEGTTGTLDIKSVAPDLFKENAFSGYGIRVIMDKKEGFAYTNTLDRSCLEEAVRLARASDADQYISFPAKADYPAVKGCYDKRIEELTSDDISEKIQELVDPCIALGGKPTTGGFSWSVSKTEIANTNGARGSDMSTYIACHLSAVAEADLTKSGFFYDASRGMDLDFSKIGETAARLAVDSVKAEKIESRTENVVFKPHAVSELLEVTLLPAFSADNVQRSRSLLAGRLGEQVCSDVLNVLDMGCLDGGLMSSPFDGEGTPTQETPLIENGVLKGYLFDTYTANKEGAASTGNADRSSYSAPPSIHPSNIIFEGKGSLTGDGLVVHGLIGAHTSNPVTGDFSLETRNAFLDGVPVKKAILSGNVFDILNDIAGFGDDPTQVSSVISPSIEVEGVRITA